MAKNRCISICNMLSYGHLHQRMEWITTKLYKHLKGLKKENLKDNISNLEIALNTLADALATELTKQRNPKGYMGWTKAAKDGGSVAKVDCQKLEERLGRTIVSKEKASDYLLPTGDVDVES